MITTGGPRRGARRAGDRGTQAQDAQGGGAEPDLGGAGQKVRILNSNVFTNSFFEKASLINDF